MWRSRLSYQEGSKHGDGGEEVPDIVVVKEGKQDAVSVVFTRLSWGFLSPREKWHVTDAQMLECGVCDTDLPGAETLEEEVERKAPHDRREEDTHQRQTLDSLAAAQLHRQQRFSY